jgi:hypothetical protein
VTLPDDLQPATYKETNHPITFVKQPGERWRCDDDERLRLSFPTGWQPSRRLAAAR